MLYCKKLYKNILILLKKRKYDQRKCGDRGAREVKRGHSRVKKSQSYLNSRFEPDPYKAYKSRVLFDL